jgi:hypothetical protein
VHVHNLEYFVRELKWKKERSTIGVKNIAPGAINLI